MQCALIISSNYYYISFVLLLQSANRSDGKSGGLGILLTRIVSKYLQTCCRTAYWIDRWVHVQPATPNTFRCPRTPAPTRVNQPTFPKEPLQSLLTTVNVVVDGNNTNKHPNHALLSTRQLLPSLLLELKRLLPFPSIRWASEISQSPSPSSPTSR